MKALITGGGGLLGRHLKGTLKSSVAATRKICDLNDPAAALRLIARVRPTVVFHLAGTTKPLPWNDLWAAHVGVTLNLLTAVRAAAPKAVVVMAGSSAEYGDPGPRPAKESQECSPFSAYGASKYSQTLAGLSFGDLDVRVARVFNAVGAGLPAHLAAGAFARQIARVEKGLQKPVIEVGDLAPQRDFVDVDDIALALKAVAAKGEAGQIYNVGSGQAVPVRRLFDALLSFSKTKIEVRTAKKASHSGALPKIAADVSKTRRALGWTATTTLEESLCRTLDSWRRAA